MRVRPVLWGLLALACGIPSLVLAAWADSDARVTFSCVGPGGLRFQGTGKELQTVEKAEALLFIVPVATITTGIGVRDAHMQERYLESDKYPTAELAVPRAVLSFPADGATVEATASGTMTIHGASRPVTFHYKATRKGSAYDVHGDVQINMNDYGIPTPTYLGVTVKPPVDIQVAFQLVET